MLISGKSVHVFYTDYTTKATNKEGCIPLYEFLTVTTTPNDKTKISFAINDFSNEEFNDVKTQVTNSDAVSFVDDFFEQKGSVAYYNVLHQVAVLGERNLVSSARLPFFSNRMNLKGYDRAWDFGLALIRSIYGVGLGLLRAHSKVIDRLFNEFINKLGIAKGNYPPIVELCLAILDIAYDIDFDLCELDGFVINDSTYYFKRNMKRYGRHFYFYQVSIDLRLLSYIIIFTNSLNVQISLDDLAECIICPITKKFSDYVKVGKPCALCSLAKDHPLSVRLELSESVPDSWKSFPNEVMLVKGHHVEDDKDYICVGGHAVPVFNGAKFAFSYGVPCTSSPINEVSELNWIENLVVESAVSIVRTLARLRKIKRGEATIMKIDERCVPGYYFPNFFLKTAKPKILIISAGLMYLQVLLKFNMVPSFWINFFSFMMDLPDVNSDTCKYSATVSKVERVLHLKNRDLNAGRLAGSYTTKLWIYICFAVLLGCRKDGRKAFNFLNQRSHDFYSGTFFNDMSDDLISGIDDKHVSSAFVKPLTKEVYRKCLNSIVQKCSIKTIGRKLKADHIRKMHYEIKNLR